MIYAGRIERSNHTYDVFLSGTKYTNIANTSYTLGISPEYHFLFTRDANRFIPLPGFFIYEFEVIA